MTMGGDIIDGWERLR